MPKDPDTLGASPLLDALYNELSAANGTIGKEQFLLIAFATGFNGGKAEWSREYADLVDEWADEGSMTKDAFFAVLSDTSDRGCFLCDYEIGQLLTFLRADSNSLANYVQALQRAGYKEQWIWFVKQFACLQMHNPHLHEHSLLCLFSACFLSGSQCTWMQFD